MPPLRSRDVPKRLVNLWEALVEVQRILGRTELDAWIFGSRRYATGSVRSDIDVILRGHVTQEQAARLWELEPYLDVFALTNGSMRSVINDSFMSDTSDEALLDRVDAVPVVLAGNWVGDDSLVAHTVMADRNPAATVLPMYELDGALPAERADVLVLTALTEEFAAVERALTPHSVADGTFTVDILSSAESVWRIRVLNVNKAGSIDMAIRTTDSIRRTKAQHVVLVGICAGLPGRADLLDVIIPESVHFYEPGKVRAGVIDPAPDVIQLNEKVRLAASTQFSADERVLAGAEIMACGEKVVADSMFRTKVADSHRKTAGLDMESYGFARAARLAGRSATVVKAVCDMADDSKSDDVHELAADQAANVLKQLIIADAFGRS